MKNYLLILLTGLACCGAMIFAQTLPATLPSKPQSGYLAVPQGAEPARRVFTLDGKDYISRLTLQEAQSARTWEPSSPIPISLEHAEEVARSELQKLVREEIQWRFSEFSIARLNGTNTYVWYFTITLKRMAPLGEKETSDSFTVLMNAEGQPGRITRLGSPRKP